MSTDLQASLKLGEQLGQRYTLGLPQSALSGQSGSLLGRAIGSSLDFQEHRDYQPGDDIRRIDWNIFARTDRLVLKLYREEVNPHLDLVLDGSRSMMLENSAKAQAVAFLSAVLAIAAENAVCTHSVWLSQGGCRRLGNDRHRPSVWAGLTLEGTTSVAEDFQRLSPAWRPRGIRVLLSDLLWPADPIPLMRRIADGAAHVIVLQILGKADSEPPEAGSLRLVDAESAEEIDLFLDAEAADRYRQALNQHVGQWRNACRQVHAHFVAVEAESVIESRSLRALEESGILLAT